MGEACPANTVAERAARVVATLVIVLALASLHPALAGVVGSPRARLLHEGMGL